MATPTVQSDVTGSESIIAGYFTSGDDAHRAINSLIDAGFLPSQVGAAFHTAGAAGSGTAAAKLTPDEDSVMQQSGRTFNEEAADVNTSPGGASSGTYAVQPIGLSSGSGSPILGAGAPGPIPGSSLEHLGLPSELKSELAHDQPGSTSNVATFSTPSSYSPPVTKQAAPVDTSWASKLKHLFQSKHDEQAPAKSDEAQNFGTGMGSLDLAPSRPYSRAAFENSVTNAGVAADSSKHLSQRLSTGGAVVLVSDTGRAVEVEQIFERHNGVVRFTSAVFDDSPAVDYEPHVEVFGHLEHRYPAL